MRLIITGKPNYIRKLRNHLRIEHPSTRRKMIITDKLKFKVPIYFNKLKRITR